MPIEALVINATSGPIRTFFARSDDPRGVAVLLPGAVGGWAVPALYYPMLALVDHGFDVMGLESIYPDRPEMELLAADSRAAIEAARAAGAYPELVVGGKSLGTLAMAELLLAGDIAPDSRTIWLTPLLGQGRVSEAIEGLERSALIVIGTRDPLYDEAVLARARERGHVVEVVPDAGHGFSVEWSAERSAEVPRTLVRAVDRYLREGPAGGRGAGRQ